MKTTRRAFLQKSAAATVALGLPMVASSRAFGANDAIAVGVIGLGIRGAGTHIPRMEKQKGVRVVAVADPDRQRLGRTAESFAKKYGHKVDKYVDMRRLLARKDIDVVTNATQNYWHGLSTIWAFQEGKHVYCEKPLSHYIWEGRQMVNAARKFKRIAQCGTQGRSMKPIIEGIKWLHEGNLGPIQHVTAFANKPRWPIGKRDVPLVIPDTVDYDLWCGPAQKVPLYRSRLQYDCSFDWNTGGGESINQGVHEIDIARWLLKEKGLPRRAMSIGGRFNVDDAANVPNTQIACYDFASAPVFYEVHNLPTAKKWMVDQKTMSRHAPTFRGVRTGVCVECEGGYAMLSNYSGVGGQFFDKQGKLIKKFTGGEDHFENFIAAVRANDPGLLRAEILEGHLSTSIAHAGNISYRLGRLADQHEMRRQVRELPAFEPTYDRLLDHLRAHEIDLDAKSVTLGPWLEIDQQNERFKDNTKANELVHGTYRAPYVVPEIG
ncbi:MAG: Gfo/Idh/MocA family oxidoreductase [Pirellulales bacterium]|nr:Gfo/Idh/MocA family oxidoreductase [Pirellulales bacterium]